MSEQPLTIAQVVGRNVRRIRLAAGANLEQAVRAARTNGLPYTTGRWSDLEGGRVEPKLTTLIPLAITLGELQKLPSGTAAPLANLFGDPRGTDAPDQDATPVEINGELVSTVGELYSYLRQGPMYVDRRSGRAETAEQHYEDSGRTDLFIQELGGEEAALAETGATDPKEIGPILYAMEGVALADRRTAKAMDVPLMHLVAASLRLWGHTLGDERIKRTPDGANAAEIGQITRDLRAELKAHGLQ